MSRVNDSYAVVGTYEDIDGACKTVYVINNRQHDIDERVELEMSPKVARRLATQLRKHANLIDPPKPRRPKGAPPQ